jgi:hypothetical protein
MRTAALRKNNRDHDRDRKTDPDRTLIENGLNESAFVYDDAPGAKAPHTRGAPIAMTTNYR